MKRVAALDTPVAYAPVLEEAILPGSADVLAAIRSVAKYRRSVPVRAGLILLFVLTAAALVRTQPTSAVGRHLRRHPLRGRARPRRGRRLNRGPRTHRADRPRTPATLVFDSGALVVDSIESGGAALPFVQRARRLIVTLPRPARAGDTRRLALAYHGSPRTGLTLLARSAQAYTAFSTSHWMVAVDAPGDRATLDLQVTMPQGWRAAGSGRLVDSRSTRGRTTVRWRQDREVPSYLFGFVAGDFTEAKDERDGLSLRALGRGFSEAELRTIFSDTAGHGRLLRGSRRRAVSGPIVRAGPRGSERRPGAGRPVAHVRGVRREVLADATATSLIAHELAHQWWGNLVTCREWTHFWLNEGFATFMAAAYKEQALGREAYLADVARWRRRIEQLRASGTEKPLVFPDWNRPTADDRALVYQKGALALHTLRDTLGETPFWAALRAYTREFAGKAVTTADFQRAVERSSGRRLDGFFDEWVYLRQLPPAR